MLIFEAANGGEETYIDPTAIIAIEGKGDAGSLVHLIGGQTIAVAALSSKIVAQLPQAGVSVRVGIRSKSGS